MPEIDEVSVSFREKPQYDYIYVNPEKNTVHVLMPLMSGETIGLDNTCRALSEFNQFWGGVGEPGAAEKIVISYLIDLEADLVLIEKMLSLEKSGEARGTLRALLHQKERRKQQLTHYQKILPLTKKHSKTAGSSGVITSVYPRLAQHFFEERTNFFVIQLAPAVEDHFTKFPHPLFKASRDTKEIIPEERYQDGTPGIRYISPGPHSLGCVFRKVFSEINPPVETTLRVKIINEALAKLGMNTDEAVFDFQSNFDLFVETLERTLNETIKTPERFSIKNSKRDQSAMRYETLTALIDEPADPHRQTRQAMRDWADALLTATVEDSIFPQETLTQDAFSKIATDFRSTSRSTRTAASDRLSILTQFFLAHLNVHCHLHKKIPPNTNFGALAEQDDAWFAELLAATVKNAIAQGENVTLALLQVIQEHAAALQISGSLSEVECKEIQRLFEMNYRTVNESLHFDEFILFFPDKPGAGIYYQGKINIDLCAYLGRLFSDFSDLPLPPPLQTSKPSHAPMPQATVKIHGQVILDWLGNLLQPSDKTDPSPFVMRLALLALLSPVSDGKSYVFEQLNQQALSALLENVDCRLLATEIEKYNDTYSDREATQRLNQFVKLKNKIKLTRFDCRTLWHLTLYKIAHEQVNIGIKAEDLLALEDPQSDEAWLALLKICIKSLVDANEEQPEIGLDNAGHYFLKTSDEKLSRKISMALKNCKVMAITPSLFADLKAAASLTTPPDSHPVILSTLQANSRSEFFSLLPSLHLAGGVDYDRPSPQSPQLRDGTFFISVRDYYVGKGIEGYRGYTARGIHLIGCTSETNWFSSSYNQRFGLSNDDVVVTGNHVIPATPSARQHVLTALENDFDLAGLITDLNGLFGDASATVCQATHFQVQENKLFLSLDFSGLSETDARALRCFFGDYDNIIAFRDKDAVSGRKIISADIRGYGITTLSPHSNFRRMLSDIKNLFQEINARRQELQTVYHTRFFDEEPSRERFTKAVLQAGKSIVGVPSTLLNNLKVERNMLGEKWVKQRFPKLADALWGSQANIMGWMGSKWFHERCLAVYKRSHESCAFDFLISRPSDPVARRVQDIKMLFVTYYAVKLRSIIFGLDEAKQKVIDKIIMEAHTLEDIKKILDDGGRATLNKTRSPVLLRIVQCIMLALTFPLSVPIAAIYLRVEKNRKGLDAFRFFAPDGQLLQEKIDRKISKTPKGF